MKFQPPQQTSGHDVTAVTSRGGQGGLAFTLLELLVVMGIMAIIAGLALPSIRNLSKPKGTSVALRQILDDLSYARSLALSTRSSVYFVMVPTNLFSFTNSLYNTPQLQQLTNLISYQYRGYALYQRRSVGDQPGQSNPRYLTGWRGLPDQILFPPQAYDNMSSNSGTFARANFFFPTVDAPAWTLHYVAFNSQGQLVQIDSNGDEIPTHSDALIPLTEGSIMNLRNADDTYQKIAADVFETPLGRHTNVINRVRINSLTGRGRIERPELQ